MEWCQSPLLLLIRLVWGSQFYMAGHGKLANLERTTGFFAELGIPYPKLNAIAAGGIEMVGGLCLVLGLGGRVVTIPLIFTMAVAYATAHKGDLHDLDKFIASPPFTFLFASVLILVFGSGSISADYFVKKQLQGDAPKK